MTNISEKTLTDLGYLHVHSYDHDEFKTKRFDNGVLLVEVSYKDGKPVFWDITVEEMTSDQLTVQDLTEITHLMTKIFNRKYANNQKNTTGHS